MSVHFTAAAPATYYELLEPAGAPRGTLLLLHGGAHTGACYLATVDGRPGWAYDFVRHGYRVVVPDWPGRGRSGYVADEALTGAVVCAGLANVIDELAGPVIVLSHSMSGHFGWKLLELRPDRIAAVVGVAPAPPGNMQPAPIVVSETPEAIQLTLLEGATVMTLARGKPLEASAAFVDVKLVGTGTRFPRDLVPAYARTLHPVPSRLLFERVNANEGALRFGDVSVLAGKPIVIVSATHDIDHPRAFEQRMVDWLNAQGARAMHLHLGDRGIVGNGHMMMLETNSSEIADAIAEALATAL